MAKTGIDVKDSITRGIREVYFVPETKMMQQCLMRCDFWKSNGFVVENMGAIWACDTEKGFLKKLLACRRRRRGPEEEFSEISKNEFQVDGIMSILEFNDELGVKLPQGEFDTVAGFVLEILGHIPLKVNNLIIKTLVWKFWK
ncbi:MAG: hypothetical protein CM1200mP38_8290 [Dehalococcoidia bacterium]|nr:MAG: hypothetical protein CM1200mP38_8290 [Dehalococcoidia bacterium]